MSEEIQEPFERALRLILELHALAEAGNNDGPEADEIRDKLDVLWGWHGGSHSIENELTAHECELLSKFSEALYGDKRR